MDRMVPKVMKTLMIITHDTLQVVAVDIECKVDNVGKTENVNYASMRQKMMKNSMLA